MPEKKPKTFIPIAPGHRACAGCGQMIAARTAALAFGPDVIVANATGCLEVTTTPYPESSWGVPWIHSLFENAASVATGILAALKAQGKEKQIKVIVQGGDGGTFDIGMGQISGMWERRDDILYICYDTEAYSNTGIQASGATPWGASTTTTPGGKCMAQKDQPACAIDSLGSHQAKKDMVSIALAHGLNYVAQTTAGFTMDITEKVKKALSLPGPSYIQILSPCVPGWKSDQSLSVTIAKLAAQTGLYPLIEYTNGQLTKVMKVPEARVAVDEYLKLQGRFAHLFKNEEGKRQIEHIQKLADENIRKYGLA